MSIPGCAHHVNPINVLRLIVAQTQQNTLFYRGEKWYPEQMPNEKYDHQVIEKKWQKRWIDERVFSVTTPSPAAAGATPPIDRRGQYVLDMFPYPSGDGLHVGHPEGYTATDIYSRFLRMKGVQVLHPMGWDAFGLPAENYAIKMGVHPSVVTAKNIANFKRQIQSLGFSYDWDREVNTTDPAYYKWTQWIFLQLFKRGLAYEKEAPIWWCPKDKTGLANEEVVNGKCDRCGTTVEKKMLKQWMLKITAYADRLLEGLNDVDWPEGIKTLQRNWIGKSEGVEVSFELVVDSFKGEHIKVFTTRPDTLFGATYLVLSPEHELVKNIIAPKQKKAVEKYVKSVAAKSDLERTSLEKEKTGVFTGAYAVNPVNQEKIPVWIADYVLSGYGTGAIMAVPAHDERDYAFAKKFKLPIIEVVTPPARPPLDKGGAEVAYMGEGEMANSGKYDGLQSADAREKIVAMLGKEGKAKATVQYKLRDWVFSRQRYWGEPIPLVHCQHCVDEVESTPHHLEFITEEMWQQFARGGQDEHLMWKGSKAPNQKDYIRITYNGQTIYVLVKKATLASGCTDLIVRKVLPGIVPDKVEQLPIMLPEVKNYEPTGTGESPLAGIDDWVNVTCRACGHPAKRETNTMPQWAGSCWYYLRFCDPKNDQEFASAEALKQWLPVDMYVGGAEHAVLHLLYARFWHKVLYDAGYIPKEVGDEPFKKLKNQGLILGPDGEKMSKSRGNVINPDEIVEKFGADTLRMYEMFMGPFEDAKPWDTNGILGVRRFLDKAWVSHAKVVLATNKIPASELQGAGLAYEITKGIEEFRFNTCVSDLMKWVNRWNNEEEINSREYQMFLKVLSPFAPHIAEELWEKMNYGTVLAKGDWPHTKRWVPTEVTIAVQVMGKLRGTLTMPSGSDQASVESAARTEENVAKYLTSEPKKVVFVQDRLINFVL